MKKALVIGNPISHSKSPLIHNYWLKQNNIPGDYDKREVSIENFENDILNIINQGYEGFNITIPFKEKIIDMCETISEEAKYVGAVNTVKIMNGKLHGYNTDVYGLIENLKIKSGVEKFNFAVIIGAGGAARSAIVGFKKLGVEKIFVINRTIEKAKILADEFGVNYENIVEINNLIKKCDVIVNTTSMGMKGENNLNVDFDNCNKNLVVYDIVYEPLMTNFLNDAKNNNLKIVTGVGMLIHQAIYGFKLWFCDNVENPEFNLEEIENILLKK